MPDNHLFTKHDLHAVIENQIRAVKAAVAQAPTAVAAAADLTTLVDSLVEEFRFNVPQLHEDQIEAEQEAVQVDARTERHRFAFAPNTRTPILVQGTRVSFCIPFTGDSALFNCRPSSYTSMPPRGTIRGSEVVVSRQASTLDVTALKQDFDRELSNIKLYLASAAQDCRQFNETLRGTIQTALEARRSKLLEGQAVAANLGFPVRRREGAPSTFAVPIKKRVLPAPPPASAAPAEPMLPTPMYEDILNIVSNMTMVLERSPGAFATMTEPALRDHFLVQLNGQFEGQATGETFNNAGKTDILLRISGRNVFIAECKFWEGPEGFLAALEQLRGYLTWRDTKAALLIFSRNKEFTAVLQKMRETLKTSPAFKREVPYTNETGMRCVVSHRTDPDREILLTVLAFNVPSVERTAGERIEDPPPVRVAAKAIGKRRKG